MVVNWKSTESQERLLACVVASFLPAKVEYGKVATYFGSDVTQGAVEFQFRAVRKMAEQVQREADGEENPPPASNEEPKKKKTPVKKSPPKKKASPGDGGVIDGKVKKTRKPAASKAKASKLEKSTNAQELDEGHHSNTTESVDDDEEDYSIKDEIIHSNAMGGDASLNFTWGDDGTKDSD